MCKLLNIYSVSPLKLLIRSESFIIMGKVNIFFFTHTMRLFIRVSPQITFTDIECNLYNIIMYCV